MNRLPSMRAVVAFEVVARHGSFGKAADELYVTISAVSHQIAALEDHIGCQLFVRSPRGVTLTAAGERFRQRLSGALAIIADAIDSARLGNSTKVLRIHSVPTLASQWLMPRLPRFMAANPDVRIRLSASPVDSDFSHGEIDADIRYGTAHWPNLHVETLFTESMLPLISPKLKAKLDLGTPESLLMQDLIECESNLVQWPQWFASIGLGVCPSQYALCVDRAGLGLDAAAGDLGIILESNVLANQLLASGRLVPVFPDGKGIQVHQHHLVFPPNHGKRTALLKFAHWLRDEAAKGGVDSGESALRLD